MQGIEVVELQAICQRKHHSTRERVEELLKEGWSIVGRDPVILQRGRAKLQVKSNGLIIAG